jgi:hypothetical protein
VTRELSVSLCVFRCAASAAMLRVRQYHFLLQKDVVAAIILVLIRVGLGIVITAYPRLESGARWVSEISRAFGMPHLENTYAAVRTRPCFLQLDQLGCCTPIRPESSWALQQRSAMHDCQLLLVITIRHLYLVKYFPKENYSTPKTN